MGGQSAEDDEAFAEMAHKFGISNKKIRKNFTIHLSGWEDFLHWQRKRKE